MRNYKEEYESIMAFKEEHMARIQEQLKLVQMDYDIPEPMWYIIFLELCLHKVRSNITEDLFFDVLEQSANTINKIHKEEKN
jgi:hypothetical protein|tara:strand:- start:2457 stop:2702 length:246 start_codon:yes stop_codon:yes gene_type:complete